jgi:hypothetical protein
MTKDLPLFFFYDMVIINKENDMDATIQCKFFIEDMKAALEKTVIGEGLKKYLYIMENLHKVDVSCDKDFQKVFNNFYRVRRDSEFRAAYYKFMQRNKNNKAVTFEKILRYLHEKDGKVELSFSSKLLHTINPDFPIWDQYVTGNIGLQKPEKSKNQMQDTINIYACLVSWYKNYTASQNGKKMIAIFDKRHPNGVHIAGTKKIDFILWQMRRRAVGV